MTLIAFQAMTPNALAEHFAISRQAVSKHIKVLTECELVQQEVSGREIYYHFVPARLREVDAWMAPFRQLWEERFDRLDDFLKKTKTKKK